jgi:peptide/nickel transport system substrate-binding protein
MTGRTAHSRLSVARRTLVAAVLLGATVSSQSALSVHVEAKTAANALTIGWPLETTALDPTKATNNSDVEPQVLIYDRLLTVGNDGKSILPDLATHWTVSKHGTVYTFTLRDGVHFQNGQLLQASDVVFCLNRARKPSALWSWTLSAIKSVSAPTASTVRITLKHPWAPFVSDVALFDAGIYPAAYFKKVGASSMTAHPIGTGPYMFEQWKRGRFLRLTKNPRYWAASHYHIQTVEFDLVPNDTTRLLDVESGTLDVDNSLPYNLIPQVQKQSGLRVQLNPSTLTYYLLPNEKVAPWSDVKVRQAVNHAINRAAIVKALLLGHGSPANSFMPRGAIDYDPSIPVPRYNLALAKRLLRQSSRPHGFTMTMEVGSGDTIQNQTAVILKSELAPLGIVVNIKRMDETTLHNNEQVGKYHFMEDHWTNDVPDPDELVAFAVDYSSGGKSWLTGWNNAQTTKLSHQAEVTTNPVKRKALYDRIQQIWANQVPFLALYYAPFVNVVSDRVHGFSEMPLGPFVLQGVTKS